MLIYVADSYKSIYSYSYIEHILKWNRVLIKNEKNIFDIFYLRSLNSANFVEVRRNFDRKEGLLSFDRITVHVILFLFIQTLFFFYISASSKLF